MLAIRQRDIRTLISACNMHVFDRKGASLTKASEVPFNKEKDIQSLVEKNIQKIFGLELVTSEFDIEDFRIDTLAFDPETKSFTIIEYKNDESRSMVEQGIAYLNLMLANKAEFVIEYNEKTNNRLLRQNVDWQSSRVIFISPLFTKYQRRAIGFEGVAIMFWEIHRYSNGTVILNEILPPKTTEPVSVVAKNSKVLKKVAKEIKVYDEATHLERADTSIQELYRQLRAEILSLGTDIEVRPMKQYIAFRRNRAFTSLEFKRQKIKLYLAISISELTDPQKKARDVTEIGHWGTGDTEITLDNIDDIPYVLSLIKQAYNQK